MKKIAQKILHCLGWRCLPSLQDEPKHSIICVAPHTSNLDFFMGKLYYMTIGKPSGFLMKKDWFFFPLGHILKAMGGIPVDRSRKEGMTERLAEYIRSKSELHIAITPEGTRSYTERWKTGFYRIAQEAGIPIELAVIDYKQKLVGIFEVFYPTGDMERDLAYIRSRYSSEQAKYPNKYQDYVAD